LSGALAWTCGKDHLLLTVRLTPKSSRDALEGLETLSDGRPVLKARVRAVPEDGRANDALVRLVAKTLDAPRTQVCLVAGGASRLKTIRIEGEPERTLAELLRLCDLS
jgi:uncharacterized protein (TIGR00251 family)